MRLDAAREKRALFIGERIEDVYVFGRILARPMKEPIVCIEAQSTETYAGGVDAVARQAAPFCYSVSVLSDRSVRKTRYVEKTHNRKLFETYERSPSSPVTFPERAQADVIALCDYGHGMLSPGIGTWLAGQDVFLAANVQSNAGNYGFNLATKYSRLDYLCLDEMEARLSTGNQHGPIEQSVRELWRIARRVCVTLGAAGAMGFAGGRIYEAPARAREVVDTMGAGDAFFAVTALFADALTMPELLRLGSAAAAAKCAVVGHRQSLTMQAVQAFL